MDIVVKGRHTEVTERFRQHVTDKLSKIVRLDPKVISVDVELSKERNPRLAGQSERIEITIRSRGPVVRAEAAAQDSYAALDVVYAKLEARLRRSHDRRVVHHGNKTPTSVATATARLNAGPDPAAGDVTAADFATAGSISPGEHLEGGEVENGPMVIREKTHEAKPVNLDQALYEMELVGHDFYLFLDAESRRPSVVYRRHGYDYGVIRLDV